MQLLGTNTGEDEQLPRTSPARDETYFRVGFASGSWQLVAAWHEPWGDEQLPGTSSAEDETCLRVGFASGSWQLLGTNPGGAKPTLR